MVEGIKWASIIASFVFGFFVTRHFDKQDKLKGEKFNSYGLSVVREFSIPMPYKSEMPIGESYIIENIRVIDGDTIDADIVLGCNIILKSQRIRFAEINAPEIKGDEKEQGLVSKNFLEDTLNSPIYIYIPENKRGKFGRWIAYIYSNSNISINQMMIEGGYAVLQDYN